MVKNFFNKLVQDKPKEFRVAGSPAGSWEHTPWWTCTFFDPYERVNVWSHGAPALFFIFIAILARCGRFPGGSVVATFCVCATAVHACSAYTHVYPDSHVAEKIDHLAIPLLILGTPLTAIKAQTPDTPLTVFCCVAVGLFAAAFLSPLMRTLSFVALGSVLFWRYYAIVNRNLLAQIAFYLCGAVAFLRNDGHDRPVGIQDHHILHYCVTTSCFMHIHYILSALGFIGTAATAVAGGANSAATTFNAAAAVATAVTAAAAAASKLE